MRLARAPVTRSVPTIIDVGAHTTPLEAYVIRPTADCVIAGFFVDADGTARWVAPQQTWGSDIDHSPLELWIGNSGTAGVDNGESVVAYDAVSTISGANLTYGISGFAAIGSNVLAGYVVIPEAGGTGEGQLRFIAEHTVSAALLELASAFSPNVTTGDVVAIGRLDPNVRGFIGFCSADLRVNYSRDLVNGEVGVSPTADATGFLIPAGAILLGRTPPNYELGNGGSSASGSGSESITPGDPPLNRYCFIGSAAAVSITFEILDSSGNTIGIKGLTITTTAKSFEVYYSTGWSNSTFARARVISISGGSVFSNTAGNGEPATNNGVTSGLEPTTSNSMPLAVGDIL